MIALIDSLIDVCVDVLLRHTRIDWEAKTHVFAHKPGNDYMIRHVYQDGRKIRLTGWLPETVCRYDYLLLNGIDNKPTRYRITEITYPGNSPGMFHATCRFSPSW